MNRKTILFALAFVTLLGLAAAPRAEAAGTSVEVSISIEISGGKTRSTHRQFASSLTHELETQARGGTSTLRQLGQLAETRVAAYDENRGDKFVTLEPGQTVAKAKWEVSLTLTVKGGGSRQSQLPPQDQAFLDRLESEIQRGLQSGRIADSQVQSRIESAIARHVASEQQTGRSSAMGQHDITATIGIKIKF